MKTKYDYDEKDTQNLKLVIALSRTHLEFSRQLQVFLNAYKMTAPQFGVLEALYHLGPMRISELISKTLSTSGNMTVVIKNLEKAGWIDRLLDKEDKRAFKIVLTESGRRLIADIFDQHLAFIETFFSNLEEAEKEKLRDLLKKLNGLTKTTAK
ncbi:MarR family winged helix-turn-helix transcriptional regulator [Fusibacter tunisiensis]|uniref:DNA-binding MarR family transcriptional regulator n=1 Tax=Fusibacter tunisiensis TaxID=1008308 RepID=A0ABS2MRW5_9FIRM|nr:MarR family transcriptional regulator [Fusibacter tunisiensis]MBM7562115.1 DNA-binding MarR family transcriptional regulator [Fusibacter tunisiensis]